MKSRRSSSGEDIKELLESTPYRVVRSLGRGSMGEVWQVVHEAMGREFALKVLHRRHLDNPLFVERLRLEARAMAALEHPNVVEVTDFWIARDGRPCLVMELLTGQRLDRELLQRKRLPVAEVIELGIQALSGLAAAHDIGLVHRDLRPENLYLHQLPHQPRLLKLLDFGLARVVPQEGEARAAGGQLEPLDLTRTGTIIGSPRFIPPEVLLGERMGPEGDVYSLGVVLYLCLVGMHSTFDWATSPTFYPPSQCGAVDCTERIDDIVLMAVEADPRRRYPTARAFLKVLEAIHLDISASNVNQRKDMTP